MAVLEVNDRTFMAEVRNSDVPVLVDFFATWCGPCQMLAPVIEEIAAESGGRYKVCKVDVDAEPALAARFGVMSIPTLIYFQDGKITGKAVGVQSRNQVLAALGE